MIKTVNNYNYYSQAEHMRKCTGCYACYIVLASVEWEKGDHCPYCKAPLCWSYKSGVGLFSPQGDGGRRADKELYHSHVAQMTETQLWGAMPDLRETFKAVSSTDPRK